jgi:uncharacterized protein
VTTASGKYHTRQNKEPSGKEPSGEEPSDKPATMSRMPSYLRSIALAALLLLGTSLFAQAPPAAGQWEGAIEVPGQALQVIVRLYRTGETWGGTIDIPAQKASNIVLINIAADGRSPRFSIGGAAGNPTFAGVVSDDGVVMTGTFTQGPLKVPFNLKRTGDAVAPPPAKRPQLPQAPIPYDSTDVSIPTPTAGVTLAGTLTTPRGGISHTAVVLISGSGPQDRDSTIAGHKPFLVLADYLTRKGIAVLRVDDRGVGGSTGTPLTATSEDFATDALAALEFLRARPGINPAKVGFIGHSEGGIIAPLAAARSRNVAFIVLMAGTGVTGENVMYEQAALMTRAAGAPEAAIAQNRLVQQEIFTAIKTETDLATMRERIGKVVGEQIATQYTQPWFRFFVTYDPATTLRKITIPTLVLNGDRDLQVSAKQNVPVIEAALRAAGNSQFTIRTFPELNHLFQTSKTGLVTEYAEIEETMAPIVLETVADWVGRR